MFRSMLFLAAVAAMASSSQAEITIFFEDFQSLTPFLTPALDAPNGEGPSGRNSINPPSKLGWTHTTPTGWTRNDSGVPTIGNPNAGVAEWEGWSFATQEFWSDADMQRREEFLGFNVTPTVGNIVAVADPDEWDDFGSPARDIGFYNAFISTPTINMARAGQLTVEFDSSWRPEGFDDGNFTNNQTATITASYDGAAPVEVFRWDSNATSPTFNGDNPNQFVSFALNNPDASTVSFQFGLTNAGNDWWWAVDNIRVTAVPEPSSMSLILLVGFAASLGRRNRRS